MESPKSSPKHSPMLPPKPTGSPKPAKKPIRPPSQDENALEGAGSPLGGPPPKKAKPPKPSPMPRPAPTQEVESKEDELEALKRKDPSELTVKEKRLLAQQAMVKQAEYRSKGVAPPIRKKPPLAATKSSSVDVQPESAMPERQAKRESHNEEEEEGTSMGKSKSLENLADDEETTPKRQPRKLPPGAFNIGIPMGLPGDARHRSYTVASGTSSESDAPSKQEVTSEEVPPIPPKEGEEKEVVEKEEEEEEEQEEDTPPNIEPKERRNSEASPQQEFESQISTPESSRKNPPSNSASMDNLSGASADELDSPDFNEAELLRGSSVSSSAKPDLEQVLYWTPEVVGIWLGSVGLGSYASSFKEKSIKGYMMFDLDNSKLKVSIRTLC